MQTFQNVNTDYVIVFHGVPDNIFPHVAYRRAAGFPRERQKDIKCPYCKRTLTRVDNSMKVDLFRFPRRREIICHEYRKCNSCHETVGITFA